MTRRASALLHTRLLRFGRLRAGRAHARAWRRAQLDPVKGNVAFSSAAAGWSFTLQSYARLYADVFGAALDTREFARRLWGDVYFHPDSRTFRKTAPAGGAQRSFVQFVLEPVYKIYSQVPPRLPAWVVTCPVGSSPWRQYAMPNIAL
jgi:hypothetical protein